VSGQALYGEGDCRGDALHYLSYLAVLVWCCMVPKIARALYHLKFLPKANPPMRGYLTTARFRTRQPSIASKQQTSSRRAPVPCLDVISDLLLLFVFPGSIMPLTSDFMRTAQSYQTSKQIQVSSNIEHSQPHRWNCVMLALLPSSGLLLVVLVNITIPHLPNEV
jgi:hypothetical protein